MPVFTYTVVDAANELVRGTIDGDSPRQARDQLREQGYKIVSINAVNDDSKSSFWQFLGRGQESTQVGIFTGELSTLMAVGVPLLDCLTTLSKQHKNAFQKVILLLKDQVSAGKPLAAAMAEQPRVFDNLCVKMVEVGENAGNLDTVLRQLSDFKRKSADIKDRVLSALLYPMIIFAVSVGVAIFLMTVVIPMLLQNLTEMGRALPWPTRVLKFLSDILVQHGWWIALLVGIAAIFLFRLLKTKWGLRQYYGLLLKTPLVGDMLRKQEISRVSLIVATLLKSGVEFVEALQIGRGTSKNPFLQDALDECEASIRSGRDIGAAMASSSFFPPMVVQIYSIGQSSGQLDNMLLRLSDDFESQVDTVSNRLSAIIEPVLILILSVFVGFILFATLLPILEAGNVLEN